MELIIVVATYFIYGLLAYLLLGMLLFVILPFGYAKYRGWLTPTITPMEIFERWLKERQAS